MATVDAVALKRILIVDGDPIMRELEGDGLRLAGYVTVCSHDARDAKRILADDQQFDLIVLDLMMPETVEGLTFLRWLRHEFESTAPVILHTAETEAVEEARQAGATRVMVKPVQWRRFVTEIRELISS